MDVFKSNKNENTASINTFDASQNQSSFEAKVRFEPIENTHKNEKFAFQVREEILSNNFMNDSLLKF